MQKRIRIVSVSIVLVILLIGIIVINNNSNSKYSFTQDGIRYALTLDGNKITSFPSKGMYKAQVTCVGADGRWLYDDWKLAIENITGDISCDINFSTLTKTNLNDHIISLSGTTQGTGQVVNETIQEDNSTFTAEAKLEQSGYTISSNDAIYPFKWDDTNKTWTSTNHTNSATATFIFNVATASNYQICYKQSSEQNYDYTIFYKDNTQIISLKGISNSDFECYYLGNLTTSNAIKVTYQKDSSSSSGSDNVIFYLQSGTYNENIQTVSAAGIRYEGKNPNNYIWFNNEYWRIIGVFDSASHGQSERNLVKIIRDETMGGISWNVSSSGNWANVNLNKLFNGAYYNATDGTSSGYCYGYGAIATGNCDYTKKGIQSEYRNMIVNAIWYLGDYSDASANAEAFYKYERKSKTTMGYIGLMYASDYGYSVLVSDCARTTNLGSYGSATCAGQSWLYGKGKEWTLTPVSSIATIFYLSDDGSLYFAYNAYGGYNSRPVLYLDSSVFLYDGDGSLENPYIVGM